MRYGQYEALIEARDLFVPVPFEEGARLIDECRHLFMEAIGELDELELCILLEEVRPKPSSVPLSPTLPYVEVVIPAAIEAPPLRILMRFPHRKIVSYTVLDESYGKYPEAPEEFSGRLFRTFSKSHLLDYTYATTNGLLQLLQLSVTHYEICCENHVIDVVAVAEPEISLLGRSERR